MMMPNRSISSNSYRYGFNDKENDNEVKGEGNQQDYGMRIYDPRLGRFLSVDPLTNSYPWYTPYQFAGNKPIKFIDLDGLEEGEHVYTSSLFHWLFPPRHPVTPAAIISTQAALAKQKFDNSRAGKFTNGLVNTTMGAVGIISSVTYITASEGTGSAFGGVTALQLSIGTTSIGITQMTEALTSNSDKNQFLHNASTIPGLIAYGTNSKYAPFIDAFSSLGPSIATSGGIRTFLKGGLGLKEAFESFVKDPSIINALGAIDQVNGVKGFAVETVNLFNDISASGHKLKSQTLTYNLSYMVKKGDNLTTIAQKFNTSVDTLVRQNNITDPDKINEGQKISYSNIVVAKNK